MSNKEINKKSVDPIMLWILKIESNIGRLPSKVYKNNNIADLVLFLPDPNTIIKINNRGKTLSKKI